MITESCYQTYLEALLAGRRAACADTVQRALNSGGPVREVYTELFQRSLYQVGELWERRRISVAVEHLATSITESLFGLVYPKLFGGERVGRTAVVACVANEFHQIGGKMAADVLELHGWDTHFLGANTPAADFLDLLAERQPDLVGLSLALYFNLPQLRSLLRELRRQFPQQEVILGGQAFRWGGREIVHEFERVRHVGSLTELEELARPAGRKQP